MVVKLARQIFVTLKIILIIALITEVALITQDQFRSSSRPDLIPPRLGTVKF